MFVQMNRFSYFALVACCFLLTLAGCELGHTAKSSVLLIAVEGLGFDSLNCDSEQANEPGFEGLHSLCSEFVRFSHAYAPSTMSQATMASLLTGLYPIDHGVHHNGNQFLSGRFLTIAEAAQAKRYRTLFVSGGAPIWRKSGLSQGYEIFDDVIEVTPGMYYRPADEVFKSLTHWIEHDTSGQPFLASLFLADLQFPQVATRTREGEIREKSSAAQLEAVLESFGTLVKWLRSRKSWNSTNVIFVGLNSLSNGENDADPAPLSLRSVSAQVSLFVKPARKERDNVISWAVDRNVSLVDIGVTIFDWLATEGPLSRWPELQGTSLSSALNKPDPSWAQDRLILTETGWPDWLERGGLRLAIRQDKFLYIYDQKPLIFNTLIDRMETLTLKAQDPLWISLNAKVMDLLQKMNAPRFKGVSGEWTERLRVAQEIWREGNNSRSIEGREPWAKWYLREALNKRNWVVVQRLSQTMADTVGYYFSSRHRGEVLPLPQNPCLRSVLMAKSDRRLDSPECEDEKILALLAWHSAKTDEEKQSAQERFVRLYAQSWMDQDIGRLNYLNQLRWDVNRDLPDAPQLVDYALTLKEFEPYAKKVSALLSSKDSRF